MYDLPPLPYSSHALEPYISRKTVNMHHRILQRRYLSTLKEMLRGSSADGLTLSNLLVQLPEGPVLHQAAQAWNHAFMWKSMRLRGGGEPLVSTGFGQTVAYSYRSYTAFQELMRESAKTLFGSGWLWVVADAQGNVSVWVGENGDNPLRHDYIPLLVIDLWEHAFTLDYPGERSEYVDAVMDHLVNWKFAEENYALAFGI